MKRSATPAGTTKIKPLHTSLSLEIIIPFYTDPETSLGLQESWVMIGKYVTSARVILQTNLKIIRGQFKKFLACEKNKRSILFHFSVYSPYHLLRSPSIFQPLYSFSIRRFLNLNKIAKTCSFEADLSLASIFFSCVNRN